MGNERNGRPRQNLTQCILFGNTPIMRVGTAAIIALFLGVSFAGASTERSRLLTPIKSLDVLRGTHLSACEPMLLHGRRTYTRLSLVFAGKNYTSSETLYSDRECEISVLQTTSQGSWRITRGNVLNLHLSHMQMRPLDPRMADRLHSTKTCGKPWENGVPNEILGTPCSHSHLAEYFVGESPSGKSLELFECEGRRKIGKACTHYGMAQVGPTLTEKHRVSLN
jgi:hypothetical protein